MCKFNVIVKHCNSSCLLTLNGKKAMDVDEHLYREDECDIWFELDEGDINYLLNNDYYNPVVPSILVDGEPA